MDIQVWMQSGYPGTDKEWISRYRFKSGYPGMDAKWISGINKIFSAFSGDICVHRA